MFDRSEMFFFDLLYPFILYLYIFHVFHTFSFSCILVLLLKKKKMTKNKYIPFAFFGRTEELDGVRQIWTATRLRQHAIVCNRTTATEFMRLRSHI